MNYAITDGIHLTKEYYKDFLPTDLQWAVTKVDDDFTLYDLFRLVYRANQIIPGIFTTMGMLEFEAFWNQIQLDRDPDDINDIEYLELYWPFDYDICETEKTGRHTDQEKISNLPDAFHGNMNLWDEPKISKLSNLMGFHGVGPGCPESSCDSHKCDNYCTKSQKYAIEFTPVNNLAHMPIRVSPKVEFFPPYVESDREFHRTGFQLSIEPTLWCFITSIFWELTFVSQNPEEIADQKQKLLNIIDEAKEHYKDNFDEKSDDNPNFG